MRDRAQLAGRPRRAGAAATRRVLGATGQDDFVFF